MLISLVTVSNFNQTFQEQECFLEELKTSQKKLLKLNRDRRSPYLHLLEYVQLAFNKISLIVYLTINSFLLDELLQYETKINDSSDSEATDSSNSDIGEVKEPKK